MATPTDVIVQPVIEIVEDESLVMKLANEALGIRWLSQLVSFITFAYTNGIDEKTGTYVLPTLATETR